MLYAPLSESPGPRIQRAAGRIAVALNRNKRGMDVYSLRNIAETDSSVMMDEVWKFLNDIGFKVTRPGGGWWTHNPSIIMDQENTDKSFHDSLSEFHTRIRSFSKEKEMEDRLDGMQKVAYTISREVMGWTKEASKEAFKPRHPDILARYQRAMGE